MLKLSAIKIEHTNVDGTFRLSRHTCGLLLTPTFKANSNNEIYRKPNKYLHTRTHARRHNVFFLNFNCVSS